MAIKALTIRNLPPTLAEALDREKRRRGQSLNQTVIDLLGQGLGSPGVRPNGLSRLAGGWSEDELRTGFLLGGRRERNESELDAFLANPVVQVLPIDAETSHHYAEIVADLRKAGTPVPTNDVWIAATAARHGASVLTFDEHFQQIGRVGSVVVGV